MAKKKISPINEEFDFKLLVTIARKNLLWFTLFLLTAILIALLILRYTAPVYESTSVIQLSEQDNARSILSESKIKSFTEQGNKMASAIELMRSKVIIERVLKKLPLQVSYYSKGEILTSELYKQSPFVVQVRVKDSAMIGRQIIVDFLSKDTYSISYVNSLNNRASFKGPIPSGVWISTPDFELNLSIYDYETIRALQQDLSKDAFFFKINSISELSGQIAKSLLIVPLNVEAQTIQIKLKDKTQQKASDIVNGIAIEFNKYDLEKNSEVADKILDFIDNTISSIDIELSNSENSLEKFKKENKIVNPDLTATGIMRQIEEIQTEIYAYNHELNLFAKIKKEVSESTDIGKFLLSLSGRSDNNIITAQLGQLQDLLEKQDQIRLQATENSELFKSIQVQLDNQLKLINRTILNEELNFKAKRESKIKDLASIEQKLGIIPQQQAEYGRLTRLFTINEKFYSLLLEKKAEFSITRAGYVPQHIILQNDLANSAPVSPNKALIISACLIIGFLAGFILIITRYLLYNEINSLEEVGQYTEAAMLGIVPKYKREIPISQLLVDKNPKSVISEAFRSIRTNLQFISNDEGAKVIALTSTISGEGKTFNAINLAGVIAFSGLKVVILDLDMRKPKIHLGFNVENNHGISTLLIGKDLPENCITKSSLANLDFITAGPIPPNPAELIINPKMEKLLQYLKGIYDIIIIDLPPVGIVSDGIPIMQVADYPLYILRANYSRKMFIAQINKLITENKVKNISVILNGVEMSKLKYGYGYGYSYGYGYGYGYSYGYGYYEEEDEPKTLFNKISDLFKKKKA
ncbi:MAG: polysaccharide biosynthesis tyrosine autokinase [Bacteroidetes bacterium]|nr:polysaccharide biosynthesis tyrosine autokinase [Bacteroidota bacterium]